MLTGTAHAHAKGKRRVREKVEVMPARLPGLTAHLKRAFFNSNADRNPVRGSLGKLQEGEKAPRGKFGGMQRGTRVHDELERWIKLGPRGFGKFVCPKTGKDRIDMHPFASGCIRKVRSLGWKLSDSEIECKSDRMGVMTWADARCVQKIGGRSFYRVLEFKTATTKAFMETKYKMKGPLRDVPDTQLNRGLVQLLFTCKMLEETYGDDFFSGAYVMHLGPSTNNPKDAFYPLRASGGEAAEYIVKNQEPIFRHFERYMDAQRAKKALKRRKGRKAATPHSTRKRK